MGWQSVGALSVLSAIVYVGCGDPSGLEIQEQLAGSWSWVESTGGLAGVTQTPASTGETMTLRFPSVGIAELLRDGALVGSASYTLTPSDDDSFVVVYDPALWGFDTQTGRLLGADTLMLADACCDGFTYRWVRAP